MEYLKNVLFQFFVFYLFVSRVNIQGALNSMKLILCIPLLAKSCSSNIYEMLLNNVKEDILGI